MDNLKKIIIDFMTDKLTLKFMLSDVIENSSSDELIDYFEIDKNSITLDANFVRTTFFGVGNIDESLEGVYLSDLWIIFENNEWKLSEIDPAMVIKINTLYNIEHGNDDYIEELLVDGSLTKEEIEYYLSYAKEIGSKDCIKALEDDYNPKPAEIYRISSEWDIGEQYVSFKSRELAMEWLKENSEIELCDGGTLEEIMDDGLISIEPFDLIGG